MPGIPEYRNQYFKVEIVVFVNFRFFWKSCDLPTIHEDNYFDFKLLVKIIRKLGIPENVSPMKYREPLKEKFLPKLLMDYLRSLDFVYKPFTGYRMLSMELVKVWMDI